MVKNCCMNSPLIGLTGYRTPGTMTIYDGELAVLPAQYVDAITRAGGTAVLLPPQKLDPESAKALIARLDGLVICGGADVNPARYGQERGPHTQKPEDLRDDFEDALLTAALAATLPVLGICRGAQMLNVHLGGTLHQHLPDVLGHDRYRLGDGVFHPEEMTLQGPSLLKELLHGDDSIHGHVYHHQGIDQVAPGLVVTARGFDGLPQAVELPEQPFCLAVQWHPEENLEDLRIFEGFVSAASR
jgi:putative glutamine amidotransferase